MVNIVRQPQIDANGVCRLVSKRDLDDPDWQPAKDYIAGPLGGEIGWTWNGNSWETPIETPPDPDPEPVFVPSYITRRQCAVELRERNMITANEALAMTKYGDVPSIVSGIFDAMPFEQRVVAETDFAADSYMRDNVLLNGIMEATGATQEDIDLFFISAFSR